MKYTQNNGFTLIELLVAMAVVAIVMAAVVSAYEVQVQGENAQATLTDMNQSARAALTIMKNEISEAGLDPLQTAGAGIVAATSNSINFTMDIGNTAGTTLQPDGKLDGPNENVTYSINGGNLVRTTGGVAQPLVRNVDALNFVYLTGGAAPAVIATPVAAANLANIRYVQVTIVVRASTTSAGLLNLIHDKNNTSYQNLQGNTVYAAPGDYFRRLALSATINCLN